MSGERFHAFLKSGNQPWNESGAALQLSCKCRKNKHFSKRELWELILNCHLHKKSFSLKTVIHLPIWMYALMVAVQESGGWHTAPRPEQIFASWTWIPWQQPWRQHDARTRGQCTRRRHKPSSNTITFEKKRQQREGVETTRMLLQRHGRTVARLEPTRFHLFPSFSPKWLKKCSRLISHTIRDSKWINALLV